MSTIKTNTCQLGQSATATNNFCWYQPASPDGTVRLGVGNSGATTLDTVTVNSSGNVGIGTSSPGSKLTVVGSVSQSTAANGYDAYNASRASRSFCWGLDASGNYGIWDTTSGANNRLLIDSSGNLGLGVTPSGWSSSWKAFQFGSVGAAFSNSSNAIWSGNEYLNSGGTPTYITSQYALRYRQDVGSGYHAWFTSASGTAGNAISFTQAMTLDAGGSLFVGTTSSPSVAGGLGVQVYNNGGNSGRINFGKTSTTTDYACVYYYSGTNVGNITYSNTATAYNTSSDQRLKTNVAPAGAALQSILDFPVDQFDWISDGSHQDFGAVAQKAIPFIPEMVHVPADPDEMWGVDWSKPVPRLIKAIQELSSQVSDLKAELNELKKVA